MSIGNLSNDLWLMPALAFTHEQEFTSPGTWTCPRTTTHVEVIVVGGGGGSGAGNFDNNPYYGATFYPGSSGGGGAVIRKWVPVSSPVPVTVGAGGTAGTISPTVLTPPIPAPAYTVTAGGAGGTSAFGPLAPPVPPTTIQAGGGGGGGSNTPPDLASPFREGTDAPIYGGGGGGTITPADGGRRLGYYGAPSMDEYGGGARSTVFGIPTPNDGLSGMGYGNFGGGGAWSPSIPGGPGIAPTPQTNTYLPLTRRFGGGWLGYLYSDGVANTGGGAGSNTAPPANLSPPIPAGAILAVPGATGGSGVVIVRWRE